MSMGMAEHTRQRDAGLDDPHGWRREVDDLAAAIAGGSIVGMPLLYTMDMWFHGMLLSPWHQLGLLGSILLINIVFSIASGFRAGGTVVDAVLEAITSVGIGIVFSAAILWLIGALGWQMAASEIVGKILIEAAAVSVGVSFANAQVRGGSRTGLKSAGKARAQQGETGAPRGRDAERMQRQADLRDASAVLIGSTALALSIAPTEEVVLIAARLPAWKILLLLALSMVLCHVILFASGFEEHEVYVDSVLQHPAVETLMTCALSLVVAFALLWLMGGLSGAAMTLPSVVAETVTLGMPAVVGGAAGRLAV